nr:RNA-directed DNA polymerase, eukaryota [Tanacetum cinerariifolium]
MDLKDAAQKAKVNWAIEGDENSIFFHGVINKRRSQLAIRGVFVSGDWYTNPSKVKEAFYDHFATRFKQPSRSRLKLCMPFPNRLSPDQVGDLDNDISLDEIRKAVWDRGESKSPGPDGFTFEFFRCYWHFIGSDFCSAVNCFFDKGCFPRCGNSSFIALIPKVMDAKFVFDFRPISLIGSVYKVVTKILANRLATVITDLVSNTQSAFVDNRQILDDSFILNEVLACSVGFSPRRSSSLWFRSEMVLVDPWYFSSNMASILANGSPTSEFPIFSGLKQGSTSLSHLFYADDAVFIGEWSSKNLDNLLMILRCFQFALGLSINVNKSHLLGVDVPLDIVHQGASPWSNTIQKVHARLSKWKVKTLSIGGRLTLLKSVLGVVPIYNMSLYKAPKSVLHEMERLRNNFFNGGNSQNSKITWVVWAKLLSSKKNGGLGVSSFFALNCAILLKWVWRFLVQDGSLWHHIISAIYGSRLECHSRKTHSSWGVILRVYQLALKGFDFPSHCMIRIEDGLNTRGLPRLMTLLEDRYFCDLNGDGVFQVKDIRSALDELFIPSSDVATRWILVAYSSLAIWERASLREFVIGGTFNGRRSRHLSIGIHGSVLYTCRLSLKPCWRVFIILLGGTSGFFGIGWFLTLPLLDGP